MHLGARKAASAAVAVGPKRLAIGAHACAALTGLVAGATWTAVLVAKEVAAAQGQSLANLTKVGQSRISFPVRIGTRRVAHI